MTFKGLTLAIAIMLLAAPSIWAQKSKPLIDRIFPGSTSDDDESEADAAEESEPKKKPQKTQPSKTQTVKSSSGKRTEAKDAKKSPIRESKPVATEPSPSPSPEPAAEEKGETPTVQERVEEVQKTLSQTRDFRQQSRLTLMYSYTPVGLFIPGKHGPSLTYIASRNWSFELDYVRGSFEVPSFIANIGSLVETRIGLYARHYPGTNSFSLLYGVSHQSMKVTVGDDFVSRLSAGNYPGDFRALHVEWLGLTLGLGNRWQLKQGITIGVDWLVLNIPVAQLRAESEFLKYVTNANDRDIADKMFVIMKHIPTVAALKVGLGYTF